MVVPAIMRNTASGRDAIAVVLESSVLGVNNTAGVRNNGGLYLSVVTDNVDQSMAVPAKATSIVLWFATSVTDDTLVAGRIAFTASATLIATVTATDTKMGHQPPMPIQYQIPTGTTHIHVTAKSGNIAKGFWATEN